MRRGGRWIGTATVNNTPFIRYRDTVSNEVENKKDGKFYQFGINYKL